MHDVVLLDIIMPKMDGDQAAKEIRDLGFDGALIAMTGSTHPEDHNRFLQAGGNKVRLIIVVDFSPIHLSLQFFAVDHRMWTGHSEAFGNQRVTFCNLSFVA